MEIKHSLAYYQELHNRYCKDLKSDIARLTFCKRKVDYDYISDLVYYDIQCITSLHFQRMEDWFHNGNNS